MYRHMKIHTRNQSKNEYIEGEIFSRIIREGYFIEFSFIPEILSTFCVICFVSSILAWETRSEWDRQKDSSVDSLIPVYFQHKILSLLFWEISLKRHFSTETFHIVLTSINILVPHTFYNNLPYISLFTTNFASHFHTHNPDTYQS